MIVKTLVKEKEPDLVTLTGAKLLAAGILLRCYLPGRKPGGYALTAELKDQRHVVLYLTHEASEITNENWTFEVLPSESSISLTQE